MLKNWNDTYPKDTVDYDIQFLAHLMHELFPIKDIKTCVERSLINHFSRPNMQLIKCNIDLFLFV